jgi:hypothetical protein
MEAGAILPEQQQSILGRRRDEKSFVVNIIGSICNGSLNVLCQIGNYGE